MRALPAAPRETPLHASEVFPADSRDRDVNLNSMKMFTEVYREASEDARAQEREEGPKSIAPPLWRRRLGGSWRMV
jgi:hypothetical protein